MKNKVMYIFKLSLTGAVIFTAFIYLILTDFTSLLILPFSTNIKVGLYIATPIFLLLCIYNTVVMQKAERKEITNDKN